ncbi:hypothetical protein [Thermococcus sp.]
MEGVRKVLLILVVLSFFIPLVSANMGNLSFYDITTEKELQELILSNEGRYFFVFYHSESYPACNYMKTSVFPTATLAATPPRYRERSTSSAEWLERKAYPTTSPEARPWE